MESHQREAASRHADLNGQLLGNVVGEVERLKALTVQDRETLEMFHSKLDEFRKESYSAINRLKDDVEEMQEENYGNVLWKIENFKESLKEVENGGTIIGPRFSATKNGYQLRAWMQFSPAKPGGLNFNWAFFVKLEPGQHDSLLRWPFSMFVHFRILDQFEHHDSEDIVYTVRPVSFDEKAFEQPIAGGSGNSGVGFKPGPILHSQPGFIVDDALMVHISVTSEPTEPPLWAR